MKNIILLLIILTLLAGCSKTPESYLYNEEFEITPISNGKVTFYQIKIFVNDNQVPYLIKFRNDPSLLEDIPIQINKENILSKKQIYITVNPYENLTTTMVIAALEIDAVLDNRYLYNLPVNSAFTVPYKNNSTKTCDDVNDKEGIIHLKLSDKIQISTDDKNCIIIEATTEDNLIRAADRFSLTLLGIMIP